MLHRHASTGVRPQPDRQAPDVEMRWRCFRECRSWLSRAGSAPGTPFPSVTIVSPVVVVSFTMTRHRTSHVKPRAVRALRADVHPRDGERHRPHPAAGTRSGMAPAAHELRQLLYLGAALAARLPERRRGPGGRAREGGRRVSGRHSDGLVGQRAASRFGAAVRALPFMSSPLPCPPSTVRAGAPSTGKAGAVSHGTDLGFPMSSCPPPATLPRPSAPPRLPLPCLPAG